MNKEFVPYEIALELEEIGFDEPFITFDTQYLYRNGDFCRSNSGAITMFESFNDELVIAPLYQQAFRWFRNEKSISGEVYSGDFGGCIEYSFHIRDLYTEKEIFDNFFGAGSSYMGTFNTYEEAELECLIKLIEIVKLK